MSDEQEPVFSQRGGIDDRQRARFDVDVALTIDSAHNFFAGSATNLSIGGFFVATHITYPVGTQFSFTIHLGEEGHLVRGTGEVRWVRVRADGSHPAGLGIQFVHIEGDGARRIEAFLAKRAPTMPPIDD